MSRRLFRQTPFKVISLAKPRGIMKVGAMEFGVQFFPNVDPADMPAERYFSNSLTIAEEAERLGLTHARIVEHYFHRYGGYSPNPLIFLSALSQRTKSLRLVTGAVLPIFNHPLTLAGEIGMVDAISGGRVDIGFARAFLPHEFRRFGISPDESNARFREGLAQVERLLIEENVTDRGRFHSFENVTSLPRPTQKPRPKFYVAATQTPETFAFAGSKGYGLMALPMGAMMRDLFATYRDAWRAAGHPGNGEIMVAFHMFCHEDGRQARDIARDAFNSYFISLAEVTHDWVAGLQSKDYPGYRESMARIEASRLETSIESGGAWIGTPDEINAIIARNIEIMGPFEHASMQINFTRLDIDAARRSMQLFAREVMPRWRTAPGNRA
jgi:alkanesulfonate monooxygenase SsuD/methylene tetrahydromethanopterin reductase-like flavin-dependent oxidoreductase (luciferase family)